MRVIVVLAALASMLCWAPANAQALLDALKDAVTGPPTQADIAAARQEVQQAASNALSALYAVNPAARVSVEGAAGYAAFSTFGDGAMFSGAAAISPGVYLYQITETGLSATLTVSGTRFFVDTNLN